LFTSSMEGLPLQSYAKGSLIKRRSRPKRILVVDGGAEQALELQLKFLGHYVRTVDCNAALETGARFLPDLLLLNLDLSNDGAALAQVIRRQPWGRTLPLIALGAGQELPAAPSATPAGFDDMLAKPFGIRELKGTLGL